MFDLEKILNNVLRQTLKIVSTINKIDKIRLILRLAV